MLIKENFGYENHRSYSPFMLHGSLAVTSWGLSWDGKCPTLKCGCPVSNLLTKADG